jgi:hypothetical protein
MNYETIFGQMGNVTPKAIKVFVDKGLLASGGEAEIKKSIDIYVDETALQELMSAMYPSVTIPDNFDWMEFDLGFLNASITSFLAKLRGKQS